MSKLTLDKKALADELSVCTKTIDRMVESGKLPKPSDKFGKAIWARSVIEAWLLNKPTPDAVPGPEKKRGRKRLAA